MLAGNKPVGMGHEGGVPDGCVPFRMTPPGGGPHGAVPFGNNLPGGGPDGCVPFGIIPPGGGPQCAVLFDMNPSGGVPVGGVPESVRFPATRLLPENLPCPNPDAVAVAMTSTMMQKTEINRPILLFCFICHSSYSGYMPLMTHTLYWTTIR